MSIITSKLIIITGVFSLWYSSQVVKEIILIISQWNDVKSCTITNSHYFYYRSNHNQHRIRIDYSLNDNNQYDYLEFATKEDALLFHQLHPQDTLINCYLNNNDLSLSIDHRRLISKLFSLTFVLVGLPFIRVQYRSKNNNSLYKSSLGMWVFCNLFSVAVSYLF